MADSPINSSQLTPLEFDANENPPELEDQHEEEEEEEEEVEDDDDSDEASEEEEDGEYKFQFHGEMDPLAFAEEEDASGLQPYQRFERLEQQQYEVLAARKRRKITSSTAETQPKSLRRHQDKEEIIGFEDLLETMTYGTRRKSRKGQPKRRGRRKGSKKKPSPEVTRKLGNATLRYAEGCYEEAIRLFKEVILVAPNLSDPYRMMGLIYKTLGDEKRAMGFYMIAAKMTPKDASLWKLLVTLSIEQGYKEQANYCLSKAIRADPEDIGLQFHRALIYIELGEYQKAADSYAQISRLCPDDIEVLRKATQMYQKCGQHDRAVCVLEDHLGNHVNDADPSVVDLLASVLMEDSAYVKALECIEHAQQVSFSGKQIPPYLVAKAGICHVHLKNLEKAEVFFNVLRQKNVSTHPHLIIDIADSLMTVEQYESALKYYMMLEEDGNKYNGYLHLKIARCYVALKKRKQAIEYYFKAIPKLVHSVDARLTLSSLLLEENRDDEAISVLSPPAESESPFDTKLDTCNLWWRSGKIKLKLSQIYKAQGSLEDFVNILFPVIHETLSIETVRQKVKIKPRLSRNVLSQRMKVLSDHQTDNVFHRFRPVASSADLNKAARAKKLLQKKDAVKEAKRAATLADGIDWTSDDSDDESPQVFREPPLPDLLKEEVHHHLIVDLCKSLSSMQRYWDALEIINLSRKLASNTFSVQMMEELRTLGAQIACHIADPARGWEYVRDIINRHPYSFSAWNCCYRVILRNSRSRSRDSVPRKFLLHFRENHRDCVPPILISGNLFTMLSMWQAAARDYLEAYKLMPDNPLINLCIGTTLINLVTLDHRLKNKHQTMLQGLAFLYNNSRLCEDSQESLYNIARAYHQIGLVSLATTYYEKVLAIRQKDHPIPEHPSENPDFTGTKRPGYCDLRREAAFNLHLIYKKSGAFDLARQVLKDHVVI
ncbi:hypothetical protein ACJIZ3_019175 [Penstemon smallii]|uniref:General transcription factor 3C polypeptide 3 n=1 Tax=Penstemon smallii TaxID=265156 RepID=A0ABD3T1W4_9LAMI